MSESPCTRICKIEARSGLCRGCGRTMAEITAWTRLSRAARGTLLLQLPARRALLAKALLEDGDGPV